MKIRIAVIITLLVSQLAQAQTTLTLGLDSFSSGTTSLYISPNGGYAFGRNGYQDKAKAQSYSHDHAFVLKQVLLQFGAAEFGSGDSTSYITVNVYDNNGFGVTSLGQADSIAPDSILGSVLIPVYQILDDGSFTIADFSNDTIAIHHRFSVGVDFSGMSVGDTVGLNSTTDGDAEGTYNAWELTSSNVWFTVEHEVYSWGLDVDLAIFPVIDENDPAGINEYLTDASFVFPNPCTDVLRLSKTGSFSSPMVIDMLGKQQTVAFDNSTKTIDTSLLESGIYFLSFSDRGQFRVLRFIKI